MNKNKAIVLSASVIAIAAIAFSQLNESESAPQAKESGDITAPVSKAMPQSVQQSKEVKSQIGTRVTGQVTDAEAAVSQQVETLARKSSVQERKHDLPSDHQKANTQARAHGHESHDEADHNSSRPPGPPKKPVPTQEGPSPQ